MSSRRQFIGGAAALAAGSLAFSRAASAKVTPVTLKEKKFPELKLPRPIGLAALTVLDLSPANQVLCAAAAGYSHVGIRLVPATPTETQYSMIGDTPMIRAVEANLKSTGVKVLDVEILRLKPDTRAVNWVPFFETGARLGASQVLVAGNDPDINRLTDNFAQLCELAHPYGLSLNIEPMPWCDLSTVKQTGEVIRKVNRPNAGVLIDPIHYYRAKNEYADIDNLPQGALHYCQMCDLTAATPKDMDGILYQARNFRLSPGTGAGDLPQLLSHLKGLPISIECCNADLALTMSPLDRARMYLEDMVAVLNKAGEF
ncbi:sugar phosphate isomerase/epimerase [Sutterella sp.]|uniref:sugar phosphate isomerase/epimerase family protein n=1 Tax=Sutterella sp. TaxID=1981025 RepID=UPI0026DEFDF8|nr:sugar phosphate isomerase/epimerase [Sutterella sp.]MDO5532096.1 sugar phosphate isomerase/epimerase [Sutterella sp.]